MNLFLADATCSECAPPVIAIIIFAIIILAFLVLAIVVWCKIFSKTGYSWALGLLMFVPIANLIMFLVLAFSTWPIERELKALKQEVDKI